jgi:hypothetical protein
MYLAAGDGARRFGRVDHARWAYEQAILVAEANGINEVLVLAEAARGALAREDPLPLAGRAEAPRELAPVISALASL